MAQESSSVEQRATYLARFVSVLVGEPSLTSNLVTDSLTVTCGYVIQLCMNLLSLLMFQSMFGIVNGECSPSRLPLHCRCGDKVYRNFFRY